MVVFRCTNPRCPRFGLRTEKICQAPANPDTNGLVVGHCSHIARKDHS